MTELEMLEELISGKRRLPASAVAQPNIMPATGPQPRLEDLLMVDPEKGTIPAPLSPKREQLVDVSAPPIGGPKILPKLEKATSGVDAPKARAAEALRQWVNPALDQQLEVTESLPSGASALQRYDDSMARYREALKGQMVSIPDDNESDRKDLSEIQKAIQGIQVPEQNLWGLAIASFLPGILGAVTGSAGARAAEPARKASVEWYNNLTKYETERAKIAQEKLQSLAKTIESKISNRNDQAYKQAQLAVQQSQNRIQALLQDAKMTQEDKDKAISNELSGVQKLVDAAIGSATTIAKMDQEMDIEKEKQKNPRQPKIPWTQDPSKVTNQIPPGYFGKEAAHDQKTPISQKDAEMIRGAVGDVGKMKDAVSELIKVLPDSPKGMTAEKWSQIQSKARSAQNIYRGKSFADLGVPSHNDQAIMDAVIAAPSTSDGWMGFYRTFNPKVAKELLKGFIKDQEEQVAIKVEPYGVKIKNAQQPQVSPRSGAERKVIGGRTYEKTQGGWRLVK